MKIYIVYDAYREEGDHGIDSVWDDLDKAKEYITVKNKIGNTLTFEEMEISQEIPVIKKYWTATYNLLANNLSNHEYKTLSEIKDSVEIRKQYLTVTNTESGEKAQEILENQLKNYCTIYVAIGKYGEVIKDYVKSQKEFMEDECQVFYNNGEKTVFSRISMEHAHAIARQ